MSRSMALNAANFNYCLFNIYLFIFETVFFSLYENKVLQLMFAGASLERFGEKDIVFINWRSHRHCFKNEWTLGNNTQRSQKTLLKKNKKIDSIVSDFGYHEMFLSICHFFVWCSWQLTLCTVSIGFIVLRAFYLQSQSVYPDITKFGLFYGQFFTQIQSTYELCLSIMPVWLSTQSWNHAF